MTQEQLMTLEERGKDNILKRCFNSFHFFTLSSKSALHSDLNFGHIFTIFSTWSLFSHSENRSA